MSLFFIGAILSSIMEGGGGVVTTRLTSNLTEVATTVNVSTTRGFLGSDVLVIGDEEIRYMGKTVTTFTGATRGWDNTNARAYDANTMVYSEQASVMNTALGFNVAATGTTMGALSLPIFVIKFVTTTMPRLVTWDFNFLKEPGWQYLRYFLWCVSAGFIITVILTVMGALGGVFSRLFVR